MKKVKFVDDEMAIIAIYKLPSRSEVIDNISDSIKYIDDTDKEILDLVMTTLEKLKMISDNEYELLDLEPYILAWEDGEDETVLDL